MTAAGLVASAASPSGASTVTRTTIVFAEPAGSSPNYIFPYETTAYFSTANGFQEYLYRPLYWFGKGATVTYNATLSIAQAPVFSNGNKTVTITLKTYKWSDGEQVVATDIMFWLNIWKMKPTGYAGWFPGGLSMPTSIKAAHISSPTTIVITFDRAFDPHWLFYNELSQITPMPIAWTRTSRSAAAGSAGCAKAAFGTDSAQCKAVYVFLSEQSGYDPTNPKATIDALPTYASNPLWHVVDGPFYLASFEPTAPMVLKPNASYSGPDKPKIKEFIEKPFTTGSAEFNSLVGGTVDYGYLPTTDITSDGTSPSRPSQTVKPGANNPRLSSTFKLVPAYRWAVNYFPYNFNSTGDTKQAAQIFHQLYFRQAMQDLVDQPLYINRLLKGYGVPSYGPVPVWPKNKYASHYEEVNPYPYDPARAIALLRSHGWTVHPQGVTVCAKPGSGSGECGKGVKKGAKLAFTLQYASGTKGLGHVMSAEKASWAQAGIKISLSNATFDSVLGNAVQCPKGCAWTLENWGGGWIFSPDYYPTGEEIFAAGAGSNNGSYATATNTRLIRQSDLEPVTLTNYENWLAKELPVVWQPDPVTIVEIHKGLAGVLPLNPLGIVTPAYWYWK